MFSEAYFEHSQLPAHFHEWMNGYIKYTNWSTQKSKLNASDGVSERVRGLHAEEYRKFIQSKIKAEQQPQQQQEQQKLASIVDDDISLSLLPHAQPTILTNHKQKRSTKKVKEEKKNTCTSHKACLSERKTVIHAVEENTAITQDRKKRRKKPKHTTHI